MDKLMMTETIMLAKAEKGLSWEQMGNDLGFSPVWLTSACLGMNSAPQDKPWQLQSILAWIVKSPML